MAIGILIITAIMLIKLKPAYAVYLDEEEIGLVESKNKFDKTIQENLYDNKENNIAFADINAQVKYKLNLIDKDIETCEEEALLAIQENSDITYFQYAINVDGTNRKYVKTEQEAKEIIQDLEKELENSSVSIQTIYTKTLEIEKKEAIEIANNISEEIQEEKRIEASTINGIYIAVTPVSGNITSRYGVNEAVRNHTHQGLDIAAKTGTPIKAVADGVVSYSGERGGYGNMIILDHGNGIQTYYGHCSELYAKTGKSIKAGDVIAAVGSTGNSTGPHLHFEIRENGKYVNPQKYLYNE